VKNALEYNLTFPWGLFYTTCYGPAITLCDNRTRSTFRCCYWREMVCSYR